MWYKNFDPSAMGISGRLSELIELGMTAGFRGFNFDGNAIARKADGRGSDLNLQILKSAKLGVGEFDLPVRWLGEEGPFKADLQRLTKVAEIAAAFGATQTVATVAAAANDKSFQENFELHRRRLMEVGEVLAPHGVRLGLHFLAPAYHREGQAYQLISTPQTLLTLVQTIGLPNVGIVLDSWHWHVAGATGEQMRAVPIKQIVSVRLADIATDADLAAINEMQRLLPQTTNVVDNIGLIRHLTTNGYEGPVSPSPHSSQLSGRNRDAIVQSASKSLDDRMADATAAEPAPATA
jgi:sugar phosphate isomerase/epimerase